MPPLETSPLLIGLGDGPAYLPLPRELRCEPAPPDYLALGRLILLGIKAQRDLRARQQQAEDGARLRAHRLALGLSTRQAADRLGISRARLWRWETGRERVPADAVQAMRAPGGLVGEE